jgi:hypothetical protein
MKPAIYLPVVLAAALWTGGCAFVPKVYPRLDSSRDAYTEARTDPRLRLDAAVELKEAEELLERAEAARATLGDPALVDHLSYLAKQRVAIAREVAIQKALGKR